MEETIDAAVAAEPAGRGGFWDLLPDDGILGRLFTFDSVLTTFKVVLAIVLGLMAVGLVVTILKRVTRRSLDARTASLVVKIAQYLGLALIAINAFDAANVDLSALLGAAGIAGIALGFAAQTTVSNFISGFFLVSEKTFSQGDVLNVDGTVGVVHSVDALSIKLRTFDNQLVRIPNEILIKAKVTNITRFPARRLNIDLSVVYGTEIEKVRRVLMELADQNQDVLRYPEPLFLVKRFGDNAIEILYGVWLAKDDWLKGLNSVHIDIQRHFAQEGIEFAFPTMTVHLPPAKKREL
jgi:small-conductance mechanosensitive channel